MEEIFTLLQSEFDSLLSFMGYDAIVYIGVLTQILKSFVPDKVVPLLPLVVGVLYVALRQFGLGELVLSGIFLGCATRVGYDVLKVTRENLSK